MDPQTTQDPLTSTQESTIPLSTPPQDPPSTPPQGPPSTPPQGPPSTPPPSGGGDDGDDTTDNGSDDTTEHGGDEDPCIPYPECPPQPPKEEGTPLFVPITAEICPVISVLVNKPKFCLQNKADTEPCYFKKKK